MKRHSLTTSILGFAFLFFSAQAQAGLFRLTEPDPSKRQHMGSVSEILSNGISKKDVRVSISPENRMEDPMRMKFSVQVNGQRACVTTSSFESMAIIRNRHRGGYTDTYSCANINGISVIHTEIEAMRVDGANWVAPKADAGDGYLFLTVILDGKPSIFRIDSPYFKKAALSQDPLSVR